MKILGIESSCDETSAAVVEDGTRILSNVIASQNSIHERFGGVVPEVASRRHVESILPVIDEALKIAETDMSEIDCIAVINRPGLIGALLVGVAAAKTISYAKGIPLVAVHHLEAHIYANWLIGREMIFPCVCLIVSGGHSDIVYATAHGMYEMLARTRDDAAGEAFDKCARAMGLPYPGGPSIDRLAKSGRVDAIAFPRANMGNTLDFSFSGLKTAVVRYLEKNQGFDGPDVAASLQQAIVDVLVANTFEAARRKECSTVLLGGGVAANSALRCACLNRGANCGVDVVLPPPVLCTDNAAMAAAAGYFGYINGAANGLDMDCVATEPLGKIQVGVRANSSLDGVTV